MCFTALATHISNNQRFKGLLVALTSCLSLTSRQMISSWTVPRRARAVQGPWRSRSSENISSGCAFVKWIKEKFLTEYLFTFSFINLVEQFCLPWWFVATLNVRSPTLIISLLSRDYNVTVGSPRSLTENSSVKSTSVWGAGTEIRSESELGTGHSDRIGTVFCGCAGGTQCYCLVHELHLNGTP